MKKLVLYTLACILLPGFTLAQSKNYNYVMVSTKTNEAGTTSLDVIQYFDGMGRLRQTVQNGITPLKKDLVIVQEYDNLGREFKTWLPGIGSGNGVWTTPGTVQSSAKTLNDNDSEPFSYQVIENSSLNRVQEAYGPGADWHTKKKGAKTSYSCAAANTVQLYTVSNGILSKNGYYAANQLYETQYIDENEANITFEYTDKSGRKILSRIQVPSEANANYYTYFVYDNFDNLCYVIPPAAADALSARTGTISDNDDTLKKYVYLYKYDDRNRCTSLRLPGTEWKYMVYDMADRLVLSQDGEQRKSNNWTFNKYDAFGRMILSGIYNTTASHGNLCYQFKNLAVIEERGTGTMGYTWNKAPVVAETNILVANYYDHYDGLSNSPVMGTDLNYASKTGYGVRYINPDCNICSAKGKLVQTIVKLLGNFNKIYTRMYYDERGQLIQKRTANHGYVNDHEYYTYNFSGQVTQKLVEHKISSIQGGEKTEFYTYDYDHAGRLVKTKHSVGSYGSTGGTPITLAENTYDELGRLKTTMPADKTTLKTTYTYNVRSWMKEIKNSVFMESLSYNIVASGVTPCYNGNIASIYRQLYMDGGTYTFSYDGLSRLKKGVYMATFRENWYDESLGYDKMGNVTSINRKSAGSVIDNLTFSYNGNQMLTTKDLGTNSLLASSYDFKNYSGGSTTVKYEYNTNGSLAKDPYKGMTIQYNEVNLPSVIDVPAVKGKIQYIYSATGEKVQQKVTYNPELSLDPLQNTNPNVGNTTRTITTDYVGNLIFNSSLSKILLPNGYCDATGSKYYFYIQDHLGNNCMVVDAAGTIVQKTDYYPFGMPVKEATGYDKQPYKYNGKEFDTMLGLNLYDYLARLYDPAVGRFTTMDPLAEKYYSTSPYAYCGNNPVSRIDPDGKAWWFAIPIIAGLLLESQPVNAPTTNYAADNQAMQEAWSEYNTGIVSSLVPVGGAVPAVSTKVAIKEVIKQEIKREVKAEVKEQVNKEIKNEFGSKGKPDHQAKVKELEVKAEQENPGMNIVREKKINAEGSNRRPDVQVQDPQTKKTTKVYEAERNPNSQRNLKREEEYRKLGIEYETHKVGGN